MTTSERDPILDAARLAEIYELGLLSPEVDAILERYVARAAEAVGLPIALVSIVLDQAQYFAAHRGLGGWLAEARGTPVEWSFCQHVVRDHGLLVVEDATTHARVKDSPLVSQDGVRCYAGLPLTSSRGHVVGTLCVIGHEARSFTEDELERLRGIAREAMVHIESRRKTAG